MTILISITAPSQRNSGCALTKTVIEHGVIFWAPRGQQVFQLKIQYFFRAGSSVWYGICVFSFIWDPCMAPLNAVHVLPLAVGLCGCALCKHLVTAAVECLTTEQWTASWSIYYCLLRFTTRIAFAPLWVITRKWVFDLWCILEKNFKCNIVNMCVLITTVITTKYLDNPEVGGFTVWKVSAPT